MLCRFFYFYVLLAFGAINAANAQVNTIYRGVYVNQFHHILGDTSKENSFLRWASKNKVEHLSCYDLYSILSDSVLYHKLTPFMQMAKTKYGIKSFDAVAGSAQFLLGQVYPFNMAQKDKTIAFTGFHIEREWWLKKTTFYSHIANLKKVKNFIRDSSQIKNLTSETYIGWLGTSSWGKQKEADELVKYADVISISAYQKKPSFNYLISRLEPIARAAAAEHKLQKVVVLFSMEDEFSGPYSIHHSYDELYQNILVEYELALTNNKVDSIVKKHIDLIGWKVFAQSQARKYRP